MDFTEIRFMITYRLNRNNETIKNDKNINFRKTIRKTK